MHQSLLAMTINRSRVQCNEHLVHAVHHITHSTSRTWAILAHPMQNANCLSDNGARQFAASLLPHWDNQLEAGRQWSRAISHASRTSCIYQQRTANSAIFVESCLVSWWGKISVFADLTQNLCLFNFLLSYPFFWINVPKLPTDIRFVNVIIMGRTCWSNFISGKY